MSNLGIICRDERKLTFSNCLVFDDQAEQLALTHQLWLDFSCSVYRKA